MSYHIYTTKGLILSERAFKEADRLYSILTRDLGLIHASAIGVRKEVSKLKGSLQPFSFSKISFVRGKEYWRITSAESLASIEPLVEVARPLALIEKLVQGEIPHPELFDAVEKFLLSEERGETFEPRLVAHILFHLGYLDEDDLTLGKDDLVRAINEGLQSSHLT